MSILIKGMEMPKKYPVTVTIFPDGISVVKTISGRRFTATAVPVPPHGRLGDLDALLKKCEFVCTDDDEDTRAVRYSIIEDAPTIIPADPAEEGE